MDYNGLSYEDLYKKFLTEFGDSDSSSSLLDDNDPALERYRNLYSKPNTDIQAGLAAHMAARPKYENYKAGFWDQLGDIVGTMLTGNPRLINASCVPDNSYNSLAFR